MFITYLYLEMKISVPSSSAPATHATNLFPDNCEIPFKVPVHLFEYNGPLFLTEYS